MSYIKYVPGDIVEINNVKYIIIYYSYQCSVYYGLVNMNVGRLIYEQSELDYINQIINNLKLGILI